MTRAKPDAATAAAAAAVAPFFILGCVRSGTTMLRDVLRNHPNLAAPEETHYFRWAEPFGSDGAMKGLLNNPVLKRHREIDGIADTEFEAMLKASASRAELYQRYMKLFIERRKPGATRWFDKTPQNVYGAAMILASIPKSRLVHIVRNPVNVCASLRIGKVMKIDRLTGAINYWRESAEIMLVMKRAYPGRVHELKYEDFVRDPLPRIRRLCEFIGEDFNPEWFANLRFSESDHAQDGVLDAEEVKRINRLCTAGRRRYGYASAAENAEGAEGAESTQDSESADA